MNRKKSTYEARRKRIVRILCFVLAALMVVGSLYTLIYMLIVAASAADPSKDDITLRVGLMYGDGVTVGFETTTPAGYEIGVQPLTDGTYQYHPFWTIPTKKVSVTADDNLSKKDSTYSITNYSAAAVIGGYHIEFTPDYALSDMQSVVSTSEALNAAFGAGSVLYAFPAYNNGCIRVRVGAFSSQAEAEMYAAPVAGLLNGMEVQIVGPSGTGVSVVDPDTDRILFEYDSADGTSLGLKAIHDGQVNYIKTPAKNVYDGVFAYTRYRGEGVDGVAVTNVLTLDQYVEGVLPYEISNVWPMETQKAFAIAARSYAAHILGRHNTSYNFDLCNGSHCQVYRGAGRVNQNVIDAVESTHGLIIAYNGKVASTYYSSSCGGYTAGIGDVWGGASHPYLVAHATPWENYAKHSNGFWTVEVSPTELLTYLRDQKGYTELGGYITAIEVVEYAPGSTYVKKLRIHASNGASVEFTNTDRVRGQLSAYLKSANFVVGQGSVAYTVDTVSVVGETVIDNAVEKQVRPPVSGGSGFNQTTTSAEESTLFILTAESAVQQSTKDVPILTAEGTVMSDGTPIHVQTAGGIVQMIPAGSGTVVVSPSIPGGVMQLPRTIKEYAVTTETKIATASNPQNFIFVGKGWGHGAGMSQYGAKDLADLGYDYEHIINAYYTNVDIVYYSTLAEFQ